MSASSKDAMAARTGAPQDRIAHSHTGAMRAMHWATAMVLLCAYPAAWAIENATTPAQAAWLAMVHRSFGLSLLVLTALRFAWRQSAAVPPLPDDVPRLQRLAARTSVIGLYVLLATQPVLGLVASLLHGDRIAVFGDVALPAILPIDRPLARQVFAVHGLIAWLLLTLTDLNVAAALHHHFMRRDDVLARMLPELRRAASPAGPRPAKLSR